MEEKIVYDQGGDYDRQQAGTRASIPPAGHHRGEEENKNGCVNNRSTGSDTISAKATNKNAKA